MIERIRGFLRSLEWPLMWKSTHDRRVRALVNANDGLRQELVAEKAKSGRYV